MRTAKNLAVDRSVVYECELSECVTCNSPLSKCNYRSGRKVVQSLDEVLAISYQPYRCMNPECANYGNSIRSASWLQLAPLHCTYGFDVIAQIGRLRQDFRIPFEEIYAQLKSQVVISESEVRHLYYERYLPLLACYERLAMPKLEEVATKSGLLLTLDGLAPEGGEPQLWVVRELQTGLTLRAGWLSRQTQVAFENFLQPIADLNLPISAILSDKQKGLLGAIGQVFKNVPHAFCQSHYLKNLAEPIAALDQQLKVTMRKTIRQQVGELIRQEDVESPGVLTVTGLIPSPIEKEAVSEVSVQVECEVQTETSGQVGAQSQVETYISSEIVNYEQIDAPNEPASHRTNHLSQTDLQNQAPTSPITGPIKVTVESDLPNQVENEPQSAVQACTAVHEFENESQSGKNLSQERDEIMADLTRRVRYLLTLKGRPP